MNDAAMPAMVYTIWWTGLLITLLVFVPLAVSLLHRTWRAANSIRHYAADTLTAAAGIAGNTRHITALDATIGVASDILATAGGVAGKLGTIADVLAERAPD